MALHKDFPDDPHAILDPSIRWFPADESLRETSAERLMAPFVPQLRRKVKEFRDGAWTSGTTWRRSPRTISLSASSSTT